MKYTETFSPDWEKLWKDVNTDIFVRTLTVEKFKERFLNSTYAVYAVENDTVVGYIRVLSDGTFAYLPEIWVHPNYRRQNIGTTLMKYILNLIPNQHVYVYAMPNGSFFYKFGFKPQGTGLGLLIGSL